jgi:hypothetical protein
LVAVALVAGPAGVAHADRDDLLPEGPPSTDPRSPGKAMILTGVVPALLVAGGATMMAHGEGTFELGTFLAFSGGIVGPAAGSWYAGEGGGVGILARTGAAAIVAYGGRLAYTGPNDGGCGPLDTFCQDERAAERRTGQYLMYAGAGLWLASVLHDMRNAERATVRRNREYARRGRPPWETEPEAPSLRPPGLATRPVIRRRGRGRSSEAAVAIGLLVPAATIGWGKVMLTSENDLDSLGWVVIGTGVTIGPAAGLWYAGKRGGYGISLRSLIGIVMLIGAEKAFDDINCFGGDPTCFDEANDRRTIGRYTLAISSALWLTSWAYDLRAASRATRSWNEARGLTLAPTVISTAAGQAPGFVLSGGF